MRLGWLSPDGTNDWSTVSSLGTDIEVRIGIFKEFLADPKNRLVWFGMKKGSGNLEGKSNKHIDSQENYHGLVNKALSDATKLWKAGKVKNPHDYTMSKWISNWAIEYVLHFLEHEPLPKLDAFFAKYMDNGYGQIVYFTCLLIHYARRGTLIYVSDNERRFRYISELKRLAATPRSNMYEHRLERYVPHSFIDELRGKIRMAYAFDASSWDDSTKGYYRGLPIYLPTIYDEDREVKLDDNWWARKKIPVITICNDSGRRPMIEKWFGGLEYKSRIYGNWRRKDPEYVKQFRATHRLVHFIDSIPQDRLLHVQSRSFATIYTLPEMAVKLGQVTYRPAEAPLAGTLMLTPVNMEHAEDFTLPQFIVKSVDELNKMVGILPKLTRKTYRAMVEEERDLVKLHFGRETMYGNLMYAFKQDGVKI